MNAIEQVEHEIKTLLSGETSSNEISRESGVTLSTISRLRSGKVALDNVSFTNVKRLYIASNNVNDTDNEKKL
ncbi:DNA-binding protein [Macrococcus capreoli]|uniref:DNA-binding protein n=1 Tax=Macrococcus capreoli TaxID=2982690 RepID=UPI0021D5E2AD|nr:DNA-binding protein [Macrococcus sp. TMW 2.2395]